MENSNVNLTFEIQIAAGEEITLPKEILERIGPGRWLVTVQPATTSIRSHRAFLDSYAPEDEGLYDAYPAR